MASILKVQSDTGHEHKHNQAPEQVPTALDALSERHFCSLLTVNKRSRRLPVHTWHTISHSNTTKFRSRKHAVINTVSATLPYTSTSPANPKHRIPGTHTHKMTRATQTLPQQPYRLYTRYAITESHTPISCHKPSVTNDSHERSDTNHRRARSFVYTITNTRQAVVRSQNRRRHRRTRNSCDAPSARFRPSISDTLTFIDVHFSRPGYGARVLSPISGSPARGAEQAPPQTRPSLEARNRAPRSPQLSRRNGNEAEFRTKWLWEK